MMILEDNKLADYIKDYPALLNFLDRLGVKLGFRDNTIKQVCEQYNLEVKFVIDLMMLIINRDEFNPNYLDNYAVINTVKYLKNSHQSYEFDYLPEIESLINRLAELERNRELDCKLLMMYFKEYKDDFIKHINYEDSVIFPLIVNANNTNEDINKDNIVAEYMQNHDNLDEKLVDLKNLLIRYFRPFENIAIIRSIINLLFEMEEDLRIHELIENKILFPKAQIINY
ncbi:MAG TPA: hemerythrin domain-containing protein [Candidatus Kapabacteria bacterium]|nr:hemerythrin domain-containing protein [Candidatus Kapabacteria bacterium]